MTTEYRKEKHPQPSTSVEQELIAKLEKWIEGSKHKEHCNFREWQCSQPGCAETHSTPCDCGKDALLSEVAAYRRGKPTPDSQALAKIPELIEALREPAMRKDGSTDEWYCWGETCCAVRALLSDPILAKWRKP